MSVVSAVGELGPIALRGYLGAAREVERDAPKLLIGADGLSDCDVIPMGNGVPSGS